MVISFEEKDRAAIESTGMSIIEFKRIFYHRAKTACAVHVTLTDCVERIAETWDVFTMRFLEAVDSLKLVFEEIKECLHYPTSFRYKAVKFISRCTGIDIYKFWKMTRHTWLARSCC